MWAALGDALTKSLCDDEGDYGLEISFDTTQIPELNEHSDEAELYRDGILTLDEVRQRLGYAPIAGTNPAPQTVAGDMAGDVTPAVPAGGEQ
jgi:hypothetical protein